MSYDRNQNFQDTLDRNGIVLESLNNADISCVVCGMFTLKVVGKWTACDGSISTSYICTDNFCHCQYSLA
jgi:hypothetical protein